MRTAGTSCKWKSHDDTRAMLAKTACDGRCVACRSCLIYCTASRSSDGETYLREDHLKGDYMMKLLSCDGSISGNRGLRLL